MGQGARLEVSSHTGSPENPGPVSSASANMGRKVLQLSVSAEGAQRERGGERIRVLPIIKQAANRHHHPLWLSSAGTLGKTELLASGTNDSFTSAMKRRGEQ